jgi:hypothetical protein
VAAVQRRILTPSKSINQSINHSFYLAYFYADNHSVHPVDHPTREQNQIGNGKWKMESRTTDTSINIL